MRLWLTSPHFYPTYGGAQNRYRSYIPGFIERGLDVQVLTGTPLIQDRSEADIEEDWYQEEPGSWLPPLTLDGAKLQRIRLPDDKQFARTRIYHEAIVEVCQRPCDGPVVVQMLTNLRPAARPWVRELKQNGAAALYSMSQFPTWPLKTYKRITRHWGYKLVYNEFDALVTNSEAIGEFLRGMGVKTRVEYIPNGVNLQRFHPPETSQEQQEAEDLRTRFGIPLDHKVIAVVGAVMLRKGTDKIISAWRLLIQRFPDTHLLFVGPRADIHDPKLRSFGVEIAEQVKTSGAPEKVHFAGVVDDVESYLRASDLFILASKREGTPNSVLEAMASGLPCLVTPYIGISAGIGQAGAHYKLVDRNPQDITSALELFLADPDAARAQGERGRRFVLEHADQKVSLDRYVELYKELGAMAAARQSARK